MEVLFIVICAVIGYKWMGSKGKSKVTGAILGGFLNVIGLGIIWFMVKEKKPVKENVAKPKREKPKVERPLNVGYKTNRNNGVFRGNWSYDLNCGHKILVNKSDKVLGKEVYCDICKFRRLVVRMDSAFG